jgi:hypothetical protein
MPTDETDLPGVQRGAVAADGVAEQHLLALGAQLRAQVRRQRGDRVPDLGGGFHADPADSGSPGGNRCRRQAGCCAHQLGRSSRAEREPAPQPGDHRRSAQLRRDPEEPRMLDEDRQLGVQPVDQCQLHLDRHTHLGRVETEDRQLTGIVQGTGQLRPHADGGGDHRRLDLHARDATNHL